MNRVWALVRRDVHLWFVSGARFLLPGLFALLSLGMLFGLYGFFEVGQAELRGIFRFMPWLVLVWVPALAMGGYALDRSRGTDEILRAMPLSEWQWVLGKFGAGVVQMACCLLATVTFPISLFWMGEPDAGVILTSYGGLFLWASAALAVAQWVSGWVRSFVSAYLLGAVVLFVWMMVGLVVPWLGWLYHFGSFERGVVDTRDVAYFVGVTLLMLWVQVAWLKWRRLS